jgi:CDP-glycerol glycerophosphotransferase (TagB/SpsB family)
MTLSYYFSKIPYTCIWHVLKLFRKHPVIAFYCDNELDIEIFRNIELKHATFVAKNKKIKKYLKQQGILAKKLPAFPDVVIMARHALHKFPAKSVIKIGLRHGPYHFKKMIAPAKYNAFDLFLLTSNSELEIARQLGFETCVSGGYPKLDSFKKTKTIQKSQELFQKFQLSKQKKTLLFSATWDGSGLSAIGKWVEKIETLSEKFNIIVTLHPKMSSRFPQKIQNIGEIQLAEPDNLIECMIMADFLISDTSSIIGEFCALDKPIITFKMDVANRLTPEIATMIAEISLQIDDFEELPNAIDLYLQNPDFKKQNRSKWNRIMFDDVTISHGKKATDVILSFLQAKGVLHDS